MDSRDTRIRPLLCSSIVASIPNSSCKKCRIVGSKTGLSSLCFPFPTIIIKSLLPKSFFFLGKRRKSMWLLTAIFDIGAENWWRSWIQTKSRGVRLLYKGWKHKIAAKLTIMVFILQSSLSKRRFHGDTILSCKASRYIVSASACWSALSSAIRRLFKVTKFGFTPLFDERILS